MGLIEFVLAVVTVVPGITWVACRWLVKRDVSRDLAWRIALVVVALTPALAFVRSASTAWQWPLAILPAERVAADHPPGDLARSVPAREPLRPGPGAGQAIAPEPLPPELLPLPLENDREALDVETAMSPPASANDSAVVVGPENSLSWWTIAGCVWCAGLLVQCGRFVRLAVNARRIVAGSEPVGEPAAIESNCWAARQAGLRRPIPLLQSPRVDIPIVSGLFHPTIVVPAGLSTDEEKRPQLRAALLHEYGHVHRCDLQFEALLKLVVAVFWPYPLIHLMAHELRRLREEICDNFVLQVESPVAYSEMLLSLAVGRASEWGAIGLAMISTNRLEHRIDSILAAGRQIDTRPPRSTGWLLASATTVALAAAIGIRIEHASAAATDEPVVASPQPPAAEPSRPPREYVIRIVDAAGNPVEGAIVTCDGMSIQGGYSSVDRAFRSVAKSGVDGSARLVFTPQMDLVATQIVEAHHRTPRPAFGGFVLPEPRIAETDGVSQLGLRVEHPSHPVRWEQLALAGDRKVVLADSTTIRVHADRSGDLYPYFWSDSLPDWEGAGADLTIRRVDLASSRGTRWLRIVQVPANGPAWFSEQVNVKRLTGNPVSIDVTLKPGVRVTGALADAVPRPVKNGRVTAVVIDLQVAEHRSWSAIAEISPDGTFVFESLPPDRHLQLIARCDGWLSRSPTAAETKAWGEQRGIKRLKDAQPTAAGMITAQLHELTEPITALVVPMEQSAACEVTVLDEQGRPLPDVDVQFTPNETFHYASAGTDEYGDMIEFIRKRLSMADRTEEPPQKSGPDSRYRATTDHDGIARVVGLPVGSEDRGVAGAAWFYVGREGYVALPDSALAPEIPFPVQRTTLTAGKFERVTVRMKREPNAAPAGPAKAAAGADKPKAIELSGRVLDERGRPVAGVQVLPFNEDCFNIVTDQNGRFRHKFDESPISVEGVETELMPTPIRFVKAGYAPQLADIALGIENQTITMRSGTYFEGTIRQADGTPAPNVLVCAFDDRQAAGSPVPIELRNLSETNSDDRGRYKLLVQPGRYLVAAGNSTAALAWLPPRKEQDQARSFLSIAADEAQKLDIRLEPGVVFRTRIVDSVTGKPVPDVFLSEEEFPSDGGFAQPVRHVAADGSPTPGVAEIRKLPAGELRFRVVANGYLRAWSDDASVKWKEATRRGRSDGVVAMVDRDDGIVFDLKPGMPEVLIQLEPAVTLRGRVLDPDGKPVESACVRLVLPSTAPPASRDEQERRRVLTDADGRFAMELPASDGRKVNLMVCEDEGDDRRPPPLRSEPHWTRRWANGVTSMFEIVAGQPIDDMELRLTRPGTIRGRIVDRKGQPVAGVAVRSAAIDAREGGFRDPTAESGRDGTFDLRFVRPGRHRLLTGDSKDSRTEGTDGPIVIVKAAEATDAGDVPER